MSPWIRWIFIDILPPIIRVNRPKQYAPKFERKSRVQKERERFLKRSKYSSASLEYGDPDPFGPYDEPSSFDAGSYALENNYSPEVERAIEGVKFIADKFRENKDQENVRGFAFNILNGQSVQLCFCR